MWDVIIIGGGLVGLPLAISLAKAGVRVAIVDQESPEARLNPTGDGRTTAVAYGSQQIFSELGIWEHVAANAEPILNIRVFEAKSPWVIHYDHKDMGAHPLGYIVDNQALRQAFFQRTQDFPDHLHWIAPAQVVRTLRNHTHAEVYLNDGQILTAPLLVAAEGRLSPTREAAGIKTFSWSYHQMALVCHATHEKPHEGVAWEVFFPEGPFAILPLRPCPLTGQHRSGIVWTSPPDLIKQLLEKTDADLSAELSLLFPYYGNMTLSSQRWSYPLSAMIPKQVIEERLVIVGDAAHVVHPVAGQGVNIGWRDAKALSKMIIEAKRLGLDMGSSVLLRRYQRSRRFDTLSVLAMTDGIVRLFSNQSSILHFLRNTGLGATNQLPPLKRFFMRQAMGIVGK